MGHKMRRAYDLAPTSAGGWVIQRKHFDGGTHQEMTVGQVCHRTLGSSHACHHNFHRVQSTYRDWCMRSGACACACAPDAGGSQRAGSSECTSCLQTTVTSALVLSTAGLCLATLPPPPGVVWGPGQPQLTHRPTQPHQERVLFHKKYLSIHLSIHLFKIVLNGPEMWGGGGGGVVGVTLFHSSQAQHHCTGSVRSPGSADRLHNESSDGEIQGGLHHRKNIRCSVR